MDMNTIKSIDKRIKVFSTVLTFLCTCILSMHVTAAGTQAGTIIKNRAFLDYTVAGKTLSTQSSDAAITVQELVKVLTQSQDAGAAILVPVGQASAALLFKVTNNGNDDESFTLTQSDLTGDDFDIGSNFDQIYIDTNTSDGTFNSLVDTLYDNASPPILSAEESISVWAVSLNFPTDLTADEQANIQMIALPTTFIASASQPVIGDTITNVNGSGIDAIYGSPISSNVANGAFIIDNPLIDIAITQEILSIIDSDGGDIARPGSEVTYQLTVTIQGAGGDATNIIVNDPLPTELVLKNGINGTITLVGSGVYTAQAGDDLAEYDTASNSIKVTLPDTAVVTPAVQKFIQFTTIIQ